jgi:hypothetical protein
MIDSGFRLHSRLHATSLVLRSFSLTEEVCLCLHEKRIGCHAAVNPHDSSIQPTVLGHGNVHIFYLMDGHRIGLSMWHVDWIRIMKQGQHRALMNVGQCDGLVTT